MTHALALLLSPVVLAQSSAWTLSGVQQIGVQVPPLVVNAVSPSGESYLSNVSGCSTPTGGSCVTKFSSSGQQLFTVELDGPHVWAIALDGAGNPYVAGSAGPTGSGLVTTAGAYEPDPPGAPDPFVCKFDGNDGHTVFCTFVDASVSSESSFTVDSAGNSYLVGPCGTTSEGCVEKLNPSGTALVYRTSFKNGIASTYLAVDASGNLFAGLTKLDPSGTVVATINPEAYPFGASAVNALVLDPSGNPQVLLQNISDPSELSVARLSADLSTVLFDTPQFYIGRSSAALGMAVDSAGTTDIVGGTWSIDLPLVQPTQVCSPSSATPALADAILVRLGNSGDILQSTYLQNQFDASVGQAAVVATPAGAFALISAFTSGVEMLSLGPGSSELTFGCLGNAASFVNIPIAPNEIASLYGTSLGPTQPVGGQIGTDGLLPFELGGTQVTFDGVAAPLLYASGSQVNLVTPSALKGKTTTHVCVIVGGAASNCIDAPVQFAAPGIFTTSTGYAAAVNEDGTINSAHNPAQIGSIVSLYVTGLGTETPPPPDGGINPLPLPSQDLIVQILIPETSPDGTFQGYMPSNALYAGPAPLEIEGLGQINVQVPLVRSAVPPGNPVSFEVMVSSPGQTTSVVSAPVLIYTPAN